MKKTLLILAALMMVVSGVAAVSAYEAHTINVKAHVENALEVDTTEIDFGTVFPEEFMVQHRSVALSDSAVAEKGTEAGDLDYVRVQPYAEWKPVPADANPYPEPVVQDAAGNDYYAWLGEALFVGFNVSGSDLNDPAWENVGPALAGPQSAQPILTTFDLNGITSVQLCVAIDTPVFEGYYNEYTDVPVKQNGLDAPSWIIMKELPDGSPNPLWDPDGIDLGLDLKIQVIDIVRN